MTFDRFASLIAPVTVEEFFESIDGRSSHYIPGDEDRHQGLFGWEELNRFLNSHLGNLQHPIVRLALGGKIVPPREITDQVTTLRRGTFQRFSQDKIQLKIAEGATLIVNGIDDFDDNLSGLRDSLIAELEEQVQINAYYSPGGIEGFHPHYDTHDVFVLQVEGTKKWDFFGETIKYPLECQPSSERECPAEVLETLTMRKGDVLYVPRGLWHSVVAEAGPSLHLTVGLYKRTRFEALTWLVELAKEEMNLRTDERNPLKPQSLNETFQVLVDFMKERGERIHELERNYTSFLKAKRADTNDFQLPIS